MVSNQIHQKMEIHGEKNQKDKHEDTANIEPEMKKSLQRKDEGKVQRRTQRKLERKDNAM